MLTARTWTAVAVDVIRRGGERPSETAYTLERSGTGTGAGAGAGLGRRDARRRARAAAARARETTRVIATMALGRKPLGENVVVSAMRPR